MVSLPHRRRAARRIEIVRRPDDRRAVIVHRRQERLGHLPDARRLRADAAECLHRYARRAPDRARRPLGTAGAARASDRTAAVLLAGSGALSIDAADQLCVLRDGASRLLRMTDFWGMASPMLVILRSARHLNDWVARLEGRTAPIQRLLRRTAG